MRRVVYLGGLLPAVELRADPIIGSGSASFEMVRYLTERLPAMIAPRWVGLVTPITNRLAMPLVEGVSKPVVADLSRARRFASEIDPIPYRRAVELALEPAGTSPGGDGAGRGGPMR